MFFEQLMTELKLFGYNNKLYFLHIEESDNRVILTYEENPVKEDSFLLSTIGETKEQAAEAMLREICLLVEKARMPNFI